MNKLTDFSKEQLAFFVRLTEDNINDLKGQLKLIDKLTEEEGTGEVFDSIIAKKNQEIADLTALKIQLSTALQMVTREEIINSN